MGSGTSEGRKAVHIEMGKQMFAGPCRDSGTERALVSEPCGSPAHIPQVMLLFLNQALYLSFFRQLRGRLKALPEPCRPQLSSAPSNSHGRVAYSGETHYEPLQCPCGYGMKMLSYIITNLLKPLN